MKKLTFIMIGALTAWAGSAQAETVVFSDDFSDGNSNGWYNSAPSPRVAAKVTDGALVISAGRGVQALYPRTSLSVGENLSFSFDISFASPGNIGSGFHIGLFDSNGSAPITEDGSTGYLDFLGIMITTNPAPANNTPPVRFLTRVPGQFPALMLSSSGKLYTPIIARPGGNATVFPAATSLHANLTLKRTSSGLNIAYSMANGSTVIQSHEASYRTKSLFSFDTLGLSVVAAAGSITIDNVKVMKEP